MLLPDASQGVDTANVHGARSTNPLPTRAAEGQGGIHLILDFNQGIQDHRSASVQVHFIVLHGGLVPGLVRVPSVDGEGFGLG